MMSPQELDAQSPVSIDSWVDIDSARWKEIDDQPSLTKKILRMKCLLVDSLGRLWGKGKDGSYYPFHLEYGRKLIGLRQSKLAVN